MSLSKQDILNLIHLDFMVYNCKNRVVGDIQEALASDVITEEEIVQTFAENILEEG